MKTILFLAAAVAPVLLASSLAMGSASAHPAFPGDRPDIWTGPPPEACPAVYDPVHDGAGNNYSSQCFAAIAGVRATWPGTYPH